MGNLDIWNAVSHPPTEALKRITGGRLNGMTDISPQWRIKIMTEQFGPVGDGWTYSIDKLWTEPGSDGQVCAFAQVNVTYRLESGDWSAPVPGIGGSMLVTNEKAGPYTSDEAFKMAVTDALSVALKAFGVAAAIYAGLWDGSKYRDGTAAVDVSAITGADSMEALKTAFTAAYKATEDTAARRAITDAKDRRKKELAEIEAAAERMDAELSEAGL